MGIPRTMALSGARAASPIVGFWLLLAGTLCGQNVLTWHNDNARTGQNLQETILTPANVTASTFGRLLTLTLDGRVDAQSLYVSSVAIPGQGTHRVVYVVTEHDSVYALDADNGATLWHVSLLGTGEAPSDDRGCSQVTPEIGITSTPVIDLSAGPHGTIYAIAMSKDNSSQYHHRLHALDLTTGTEQFGGPVEVQATYPGTGSGSSNGTVTFNPAQYKERSGLLILNGVVYTSWASHCDFLPYTGWVIGYNQTTLQRTSVLNLTPNGSFGAIWAAGSGPAADANGNIYLQTGNGTFDTTLTGGFPNKNDYGNAIVKLSTAGGGLAVVDYFTMFNTASESGSDADLGSGGLMLLPPLTGQGGGSVSLAVGAGKDGHIYVVNQNNLGKFNSTSDSIYQNMSSAVPGGVWASPAWFNSTLYYGDVGGTLKAFKFASGIFDTVAASHSTGTYRYPGTTPSISASGTSNAIVWAVENGVSTAVLHAYDAADLSRELYNTNQAANSRDHFGAGNKYMVPTIANGKVYVGTPNGISVFGLLPPPSVAVTPTSGIGSSQTFSVTVSDTNGAAFVGYMYLLINSSLNGANACFVEYNRSANSIRLVNDSGLVWPTPVVVGSGPPMSNGQCTLNPAMASASASGNNVTINVPLTFASAFAGAKNVYVSAYDVHGHGSGWQNGGAWTVPSLGTPVVVSAAPASGTGTSQTFALTLSDPHGASSVGYVYLLINASLNGANSCFVEYNRAANTIRLAADSGLAWPTPVPLGTGSAMSNSQCTLNTSSASRSMSGNSLVLNVPLSFWPAYAGPKNVFVSAYDVNGSGSSWQNTGAWTVPSGTPPSVVSVSPSSGSGQSQVFALTVSDSNGATFIQYVYLIVNAAVRGDNSCFVEYNRAANTIRLVNDSGLVWPTPVHVGTGSAMANSQCTLNPATASVSISGSSLTINVPLTLAASYVGGKNVFASAYDVNGLGSGWQNLGSWSVPSQGPPAVASVNPSSGSAASQTFALNVSDPDGASIIGYVYLLINGSLNGANSCFVEYNRTANTIRLANDSGLTWPTPATLGTGSAMSNNQCTLNPAAASSTASGNNLTLNVPLSFASPGYSGSKTVYVQVYAVTGAGSGWQTPGTWIVP
jgi:hypothetical protein